MSRIQNTQTQKELESQLKKHLGELEAIKTDINNKKTELKSKETVVGNLREKIKKLNSDRQNPVISEHALLRYFERVKGFNIEEIKKEILNEKVMGLIDVLGKSGEYPSNDYKIVLKNNVVVTII